MGKDTKPILSEMKNIERIHFAFPAIASVVLFIIGIVLIIFNPSNRIIWLAMILAPFGGLSRHFLGMYFNGWKRFPLGTFLANIFGSLILTILPVTRISISSSNETDDIEWDPILQVTSTPGMRSFFKINYLQTDFFDRHTNVISVVDFFKVADSFVFFSKLVRDIDLILFLS